MTDNMGLVRRARSFLSAAIAPKGEKATPTIQAVDNLAQAVGVRGGWFGFIRESFAGAWQRDIELAPEVVLAYNAVYACITLIAQDVGKLRIKLMAKGENGIWKETTSAAFSPVLKKPNRFQNHIQFKEWWVTSKLTHGNTYVLKERDQRGVVVALHVLDSTPGVVKVLVAPDGSVFYELAVDNLSGVEGPVRVPASEIIHDRMNCLFHPLAGTSPIFSCGAAASAGLRIQRGATRFFGKGAMPSGVLSAPGLISQETATRLKEHWETQFTGDHAGAVAVLGEGLKWEPMRMTAVDAQLIEQLKWSAETVCSTFHVPPFKIGIGVMPTYSNAAESLNQIYYSDCLQSHIESIELLLDEGLGLDKPKDGKVMGSELDLTSLIRMDTGAQIKSLTDGIAGALYTPNEARAQVDLEPLEGGDTVYIQQQNYSLEALAKRDAREDPFASAAKAGDQPPPAPAAPPSSGKAVTAGVAPDVELDISFDGERSLTVGNTTALLPIPIWRGTYEPGRTYQAHDLVTRSGGMWIATVPTAETPGNGQTSWVLAVKGGKKGAR